jgi:hypothetical protein
MGGSIDAALERLPLIVEPMNELRELNRPLVILGHEQFDCQGRLPEPTGRIQPRGNRKPYILTIDTLLFIQASNLL